MGTLNKRNIIIIAALLLSVTIAIELYSYYVNPFIDYKPTGLSLITTEVLKFNYIKDGTLIGLFEYQITADASGTSRLYTINSTSEVVFEEKHLVVNSTYRISDTVEPMSYTVDADLGGDKSYTRCVFTEGKTTITRTRNNSVRSDDIVTPASFVVMDNNNPAHWEILLKSFKAEPGNKYRINALIPQAGVIYTLEVGIDSSPQSINIGSKIFQCLVVRELNLELVLYFYQGSLLQYKNNQDNIVIVKSFS